MGQGASLATALQAIEGVQAQAAARAILALARATAELSAVIARPSLEGRLGAATGGANVDGDAQRKLDLIAEDLCRSALQGAGVGPYLSEETEAPVILDPAGRVAVAIDPLDGSSNIDVNGVIGTIFSILPAEGPDAATSFFQSGRAQIAAGFFMYGPQTTLVVSLGRGVDVFTLDRTAGEFVLVESGLKIPEGAAEYAINASNHRHWREAVRNYIDDCLRGADGPHGRTYNMRWAGSLVADAYRVFSRGGIFLYPADGRKGYDQGRLRLLYEASPIAFLAEQAGGGATDGERAILDIVPHRPHERAPLVMGSADMVERVRRYHHDVELARTAPVGLSSARA
ncbi:MAG TPA: class 1 fructose-bisphosphatase [Caulobacteraceae bacterium]|jgi:fructose-1,6-bisphosphatase I